MKQQRTGLGEEGSDASARSARTNDRERAEDVQLNRSTSPPRDRVVRFLVGNGTRRRDRREPDSHELEGDAFTKARKKFHARRNSLVAKFNKLADQYPESDAILYFGRPDWTTYATRMCDVESIRVLGLTLATLLD